MASLLTRTPVCTGGKRITVLSVIWCHSSRLCRNLNSAGALVPRSCWDSLIPSGDLLSPAQAASFPSWLSARQSWTLSIWHPFPHPAPLLTPPTRVRQKHFCSREGISSLHGFSTWFWGCWGAHSWAGNLGPGFLFCHHHPVDGARSCDKQRVDLCPSFIASGLCSGLLSNWFLWASCFLHVELMPKVQVGSEDWKTCVTCY